LQKKGIQVACRTNKVRFKIVLLILTRVAQRCSLHLFFHEIERCNVFQPVLAKLLKMKTAFLVGNLAE